MESVLVNCLFAVDGVCSSIIPVTSVVVVVVVVVDVVPGVADVEGTTEAVEDGSTEEIDCSTISDVRGNNWKRIFFALIVPPGEEL